MEIAIDFDGTCVTHDHPKIGKDIGSASVLKKLVEKGHFLILYTMRCDSKVKSTSGLTDAIKWFKDNSIPLYAVGYNPTQREWTQSNKCYAQLYIDDSALGIPLKFNAKISDKSFVDWKKVEKLLIKQCIL